ncbi:MAG: hypothetical protein COA44_03195 [Arcobacter sp.]|nr:MAG: hypothetical protein COA44_03195 [Arcobacter sp.]
MLTSLKRFFLLLLLLFSLSACVKKQPSISHVLQNNCDYYSLKTAMCENTEQMIKSLRPYKIIFIGDHHSEKDMHLRLAGLISSLSQDGYKIILANEWFYPSDKKTLQSFYSNEDNESVFLEKIQWQKRMKFYKYESFKPIYEAVKQENGELHGINLSKEERKQISDANLSVMTKKEGLFYKTLDLSVYPHQSLVMPFLSHCHAPKKDESLQECSERMYKVQVAWDTKMALEAYKLSKKLKANEKLLVLAGSMHMEKNLGIPLRFARLSNEPFLTIIPLESHIENVEHNTGDYLLFYESQDKARK